MHFCGNKRLLYAKTENCRYSNYLPIPFQEHYIWWLITSERHKGKSTRQFKRAVVYSPGTKRIYYMQISISANGVIIGDSYFKDINKNLVSFCSLWMNLLFCKIHRKRWGININNRNISKITICEMVIFTVEQFHMLIFEFSTICPWHTFLTYPGV